MLNKAVRHGCMNMFRKNLENTFFSKRFPNTKKIQERKTVHLSITASFTFQLYLLGLDNILNIQYNDIVRAVKSTDFSIKSVLTF